MKFLNEYRDPDLAKRLIAAIAQTVTRPWTIMEICGGQTHSIVRNGIDQLLPPEIELVHGPGCPVCVTPRETIDRAVDLARRPGLVLCSYGDMLRVPGSDKNLLAVKAEGGDVRVVYSPLEAVALARENPERQVVFLAVGFETTAPGNAMAIIQAEREGLENFSELASHVLVPPAMRALLSEPGNRIHGFLAAGHVCTIMGWRQYDPIADDFGTPIVVTGFEPVDILQGILMTARQLEEGRHEVENQYSRLVRPEGNPAARAAMEAVFEVRDTEWRGLGVIPRSGLCIKKRWRAMDAAVKFGLPRHRERESGRCLGGEILRGRKRPADCPEFARACTPEHPLGAAMVSSEGACAAYYRYGRAGNHPPAAQRSR